MINHKQAAFLYLLAFNIGEGGNSSHDDLLAESSLILHDNNYPTLDAVIMDNEGNPMIDWENCGNPDQEIPDWDEWLYDPTDDWTHGIRDYLVDAINNAMEFKKPLIDILIDVK